MRLIILSSLECLCLTYFATLFHKLRDFRKKNLLNVKCLSCSSLHLLSEIFFVLRRNPQDVIINVHKRSYTVTVVVVRIERKLKFLDRFSGNVPILNFI
jgi:hypothetical protein